MYNGQFMKGFIHVLAFVCMIWMADRFGPIMVPVFFAYFFYSVFDAYKTAHAIEMGQPVPDPFGLERMLSGHAGVSSHTSTTPPSAAFVNESGREYTPPAAAVGPPSQPPVDFRASRHALPTGAIVLIVLGALFLLDNIGGFEFHWVHRLWPLILIILGGWLLVRRLGLLEGVPIEQYRSRGLMGPAILLTLGLLSVISWGIILYKLWTFNRIQSQSSRFLEIFRRSTKFSEVQAVCQSLNDSPLVGIFLAGYAELNLQLRPSSGSANSANPAGSAAASRPVLKSLVSVDRALMRASNVETNKLEKHITFLATTAAVTPFIGLFGTVVGIIAAFQGIGAQGSTSLDVVAPGIADALIATAAGLAAAIPAVYFYNLLTQRVKGLASEMDDFSLEFLNIVERNFT